MDRLSVAVLAGGRSTRMGVDKALLPWGEGRLIDHVIEIAASVDESVETLIIGDRPEYRERGARVIPDLYPGLGPLGGIVTALRSGAGDRVMVLAVDMPTLSPELLNAMAKFPFEGDALVPRVQVDPNSESGLQRPETLHAIYRKRCLPMFEARLQSDKLKVADAFDDLEVVYLDANWVRRFDPELRSFDNANTPDEFSQIKSDIERRAR